MTSLTNVFRSFLTSTRGSASVELVYWLPVAICVSAGALSASDRLMGIESAALLHTFSGLSASLTAP